MYSSLSLEQRYFPLFLLNLLMKQEKSACFIERVYCMYQQLFSATGSRPILCKTVFFVEVSAVTAICVLYRNKSWIWQLRICCFWLILNEIEVLKKLYSWGAVMHIAVRQEKLLKHFIIGIIYVAAGDFYIALLLSHLQIYCFSEYMHYVSRMLWCISNIQKY